jgi:protein-S-isoprenylcysteine O-methyltransferase Ste14
LLLFFWWPLLIVPVLEYILYPRYNFIFTVTVTGAALAVFGTGLRAWGIWSLRDYFSAHIEIKDDHNLVESGPYKFIRHPAYAGNIIQALGIPLILNAYLSLSISVMVIIIFLYRMKFEEEVLIREVMGYSDYVKRTYRLIPKIW